jgi:lipopolysaccharide export system protein LptA
MRNRVERLRLWLLAGAGLLVLVLAVFIGSARYLMRHYIGRIPAKLGLNVKVDSNGVTFSQYDDVTRKTVYIIHASKSVEHTDGKITLHDVKIVLYGRKGDRADEIRGDEFEYDKVAGLVRAIGLVHIDVKEAEAAVAAGGAQRKVRPGKAADRVPAAGTDDAKVLHATTSGLVCVENLGVAATGEAITFQVGAMTGHAIGADYNTDSGLLMLHSAVEMSGTAGKQPVTLTAASAELNNREHRAFLTRAKYVLPGSTVVAEQATLHGRQDGTLERIEAQGNVTSEAKGAKLVSQRADVALNEQSQPKSALLTGGVSYSLDAPLQQRRGQADAATIAYDAQGRPEHAVFTGSVHMTERTRATEAAKEPWSLRDLTAAKVEAALVAVDARRTQLRDAEATGNPHLTIVNNGSLASAKGEGRMDLAADGLKAHLIAAGDAKGQPQLDTIAGRGHTSLHQVSADGVDQMSAGDALDAKFKPGVAAGGAGSNQIAVGNQAGRQISDLLLSAVQQGHVTMLRRAPAKAGAKAGTPDDVEHASGERAVYDGDLDRVTLTGGVQFMDAGSVVWANQLALDHKTGDAQAEGAVKVNYVKADDGAAHATPAEPTHILADRADLKHASAIATFYGKPVRVWQGGSQVQAPVVEFAKAEKRLTAHGDVGAAGQVHTVLVKTESDKPKVAKAAAAKPAAEKPAKTKSGLTSCGSGKAAGAPSAVRIASSGLVYSGTLDQADFTGGVRVESTCGTMLAREALVYLVPANPAQAGSEAQNAGAGASSSGATGTDLSLDGRVDRVVATGHVEIEQPGRRATGERLVYTASDEVSVLTGDKDSPPKVVDTVRRTTVTGAALRFHSDDDSVEALSTVPGETSTGQRVRTDTEVDKKSGSAKH